MDNINLDYQMKERVYLANKNNPYCDVLPFELKMSFPKVNYTGFFSQKNEAIIYVVPAYSYVEKEKTMGYTGKSAGVSMRVAKGLTVRTGGSGGSVVRQNVREEFAGDYIITNKRIIFVAEKAGFEYKLDKVTAVKLTSRESFYIQSGKTIKNIRVDSSGLAYAYSLTQTAVDNFINDVDLYKDLQISFNEEQERYLSSARSQINDFANRSQLPVYNKKPYSYDDNKYNKKKPRIKLTMKQIFILLGIILVFTAYFVDLFTNKEKNFDSSEENLDRINLEVSRLVKAENHPKIFDNLDDVKKYYENRSDNAVITQGLYLSNKYKAGQDNVVEYKKSTLFFVEDASDKNSLGYIEFYLKDSKSKKYNLDECIKIAVDYLPEKFFDVYKVDAAYVIKGNDITQYVYAVRLTDEGVDYANNTNNKYSYYYALYISTDADNKELSSHNWKIRTDYSAYGDRQINWIKENTEPWEINLKNYVK